MGKTGLTLKSWVVIVTTIITFIGGSVTTIILTPRSHPEIVRKLKIDKLEALRDSLSSIRNIDVMNLEAYLIPEEKLTKNEISSMLDCFCVILDSRSKILDVVVDMRPYLSEKSRKKLYTITVDFQHELSAIDRKKKDEYYDYIISEGKIPKDIITFMNKGKSYVDEIQLIVGYEITELTQIR